jgi:hypothetical protein
MIADHFDQITQELLRQKQLMDKLEAENRELRQRIADLRSGRGIFVDINGIRFALRDDSSPMQATSASSVPASISSFTTSTPSATSPLNQHIVDTPTEVIPEITAQLQEQGVKQMSPSKNDGDKNATTGESTFLEEIMLDEFNNVLTSPNAVWQDPAEKKPSKQQRKPQEPIDERQKEALRRELTGSYLLE